MGKVVSRSTTVTINLVKLFSFERQEKEIKCVKLLGKKRAELEDGQ